MPKEKNRFQRYHYINDLLNRQGKHPVATSKFLCEKLEISLRQLRVDIEYMKNQLNAPIEFDYKSQVYRYSKEFIYLDNLPLTRRDLTHLQIAVETMRKTGQIKHFEQAGEIFGKIHRATRNWNATEPKIKPIFFDPLPKYDAAQHLDFFLTAIENQQRSRFQYQGFHADKPKSVLFDPYFLRNYDRRWYVGGFSHDPSEGFVRTFPLERIIGEPQVETFFHDRPTDFNAESYWRHIYGITIPKGGKVEAIVLEFNRLQGQYFLTTPFFEPFEVLENTEENLRVRLLLIPNIDLIRKLASLGSDVRVLAPDSLRDEIRKFFEQALTRY